jgi:DNA-binding NarL/FixJ family response regulator
LRTDPTPRSPLSVLLLDDDAATNLDALAASVAVFAPGRLELLYASDADTLHRMAGELAALDAPALVVVDVDHHPEPKHFLAVAADAGYPLVVLSDGRDDAIADHALSVGAAAYAPTSLPGRDLVDLLATLASPPETVTPC